MNFASRAKTCSHEAIIQSICINILDEVAKIKVRAVNRVSSLLVMEEDANTITHAVSGTLLFKCRKVTNIKIIQDVCYNLEYYSEYIRNC